MASINSQVVNEVFSRVDNIREASRKTYTSTTCRMMQLIFEWFGSYPYDIDKVIARLASETVSRHVLKLRYSTLAIFVKQLTSSERIKYFATVDGDVCEKVQSVVKKVNTDVHESYVQQKMSDNEKIKWVQWPDVERVWSKKMTYPKIPKDFDAKLLYKTQEYALAGLYTVIPPVRNDYRTIRIDEVADTNYITFDTSKHIATIVLSEYKTSKKYGQIKLLVSAGASGKHKLLYESLKDLANARKKIGGVYLFASQCGGQVPLSSPNYSQILTAIYKRHLGKPLGSQMIRKIYLSYIQRDEQPLVEKRNTAAAMGHSTDMQALYRRLPDDTK